MLVGYKLINSKTMEVVKEWGGLYGQAPEIPNPLLLPNGDSVCSPALDATYGDYAFVRWEMSDADKPKKVVFDGTDFLGRVTDEEYTAITGSNNVQVRRWLDTFRLRGEIDVSGKTAQAAKAGLVALGLLTKDRAAVIFAEE